MQVKPESGLTNNEGIFSESEKLKAELDEARRVIENQKLELEQARRVTQALTSQLGDANATIIKLTGDVRALETRHSSERTHLQGEEIQRVGPPRNATRNRYDSPSSNDHSANFGTTPVPDIPPDRRQTTATPHNRLRAEVVITRKVPHSDVMTIPEVQVDEPTTRPSRKRTAALPRAAPLETGQIQVKAEPEDSIPLPSPQVANDVKPDIKPDIKPKRKLKEQLEPTLPPDILAEYLAPATVYEVSPPPVEPPVLVSRRFLRLAYGGNEQHMTQRIRDFRDPSGETKRELYFPRLDMNPAIPTLPGLPGLIFSGDDRGPPYSLFYKPNKNIAQWQYLGEYISEPCEDLSKKKFKAQRQSVKLAWAKWVLDFKSVVNLRASIALRKIGELPDDRDARKVVVQDEAQKIKAGQGIPLDEEDVIAAYEEGFTGVPVTRLQCVGYDHEFVADLQEKLPTLDELVAQAEKARKTKPPAGMKQGKGAKAKKGRKNIQEDDSDSDERPIFVDSDDDANTRPRKRRNTTRNPPRISPSTTRASTPAPEGARIGSSASASARMSVDMSSSMVNAVDQTAISIDDGNDSDLSYYDD